MDVPAEGLALADGVVVAALVVAVELDEALRLDAEAFFVISLRTITKLLTMAFIRITKQNLKPRSRNWKSN
jgi:hypothetical protein